MRWILAEMQLSDLIDIAVVSGLLWVAMVWLRNSRARLALLGAAMLGGVYLVAAQLRLDLTARILQGFFAVSVLVGVIVFQDQVLQIANRLAGYSLGEADLLRRAMGKKKASEMEKQRERFVEGAVQRGIDRGKAEEVFALMAEFAGYGFAKSHSTAYALITYQTAYLKANIRVSISPRCSPRRRATTTNSRATSRTPNSSESKCSRRPSTNRRATSPGSPRASASVSRV